jgi:circadian clock protein KaiC
MTTGIAGCDRILKGGFLSEGVYMIQGAPGTGKTTFGNQFAYHHVCSGQRVLYVTMLAELHARMLIHLRTMSFFDPTAVPDKIVYFSGFKQLEESGLRGLLEVVRKEIPGRGASLLVMDGLISAHESAASARELRKFVQELQALASFHECTMLLLTSDLSVTGAEHTMVDGLIELRVDRFGHSCERSMSVHKFRGSESLPGRHTFKIDGSGITIYPRLESICDEFADVLPDERISTGVPSLDSLLGRGSLPVATTTVLLGAPGTGKTSLGLTFVAQSTEREPGLVVSFRDSPAWLNAKGRSLGLDIGAKRDAGTIGMLWYPTAETPPDDIANRLLDEVRSRGVKRLFIDGVESLQASLQSQKRHSFLAAFAHLLRSTGVTTMLSAASTHELIANGGEGPSNALSPFLDNILSLRTVSVRSQSYRILSVQKLKDANFDPRARAFQITSEGIEIDATPDSAEAILMARAREGDASLPLPPTSKNWRGNAASKHEDGSHRR